MMLCQIPTSPNLDASITGLLNVLDLAESLKATEVDVPQFNFPEDQLADQTIYWTVEYAHTIVEDVPLRTINLCVADDEVKEKLVASLKTLKTQRL